jgi:ATP-dependent helicase/nuclease subunit A
MSPSLQDLTLAADANQARASDPDASAWVSANAGTGKTEVLVKRVLRLLLAGARPECILCLTYTKTAAAEMQNRLLKELAQWATLPPAKLRKALAALLGREPEEADLRAARRLFASALEAKGGLKIYTIHAFCERLLQRFPLEADVTPHFSVLDEAGAALLRGAAFDAVVSAAAKRKDGPLGEGLAKIIACAGEEYFRQVVDSVLGKRAELVRMFAYHGSLACWAKAECTALKRLCGIAADESEEHLVAQLADVIDDAAIDAALVMLDTHASTATDRKLAEALRTARPLKGESRIAVLTPVFLTEKHEPRKQICSAALQRAHPDLHVRLTQAQARFAALDAKLAHLACAEASGALLTLADAILAEYTRAKRAEAVLDYDDLILKTSNLLHRAGAAAWVLFKIDGGIDHILVDEAQDTNPAQWGIIERLAEEFFAGLGASGRLRTLFAVGDEKQSIYSFQGADPARFGTMGRGFANKAAAAGLAWNSVPLTLSFRSTEPVLKAVDEVFAKRPAADGLSWAEGDSAPMRHHAFRQGQAGLVELWESISETPPEPAGAFEPWNEKDAAARSVELLCMRIAATIKDWLREGGEQLPSENRPVRAGDILILVRRRDPFTTPMIRALKRARVPVAGADRMRLMEQLAVEDLVALADMLLMPEDDLALAVVLKSPLFGLDDDALFALAYGRRASLWAALKEKAAEDDRFAEAAACLSAWLARADLMPPYEFFSDVLSADGQLMRKRFLRRLGPEAAEAIDEFLDRALAYDREAAPSLQGFIHQLRANDIEVKRDMDQERDEVRIMTVHGAKGLQAPIVFLPDTCMLPRQQGPRLYGLPRRKAAPDEVGHLIWAPGGQKLDALADAKAALDAAELQEYHRLLYVAMTRACDRLYVCGFEGTRKRGDGCWYDLVQEGLRDLLSQAQGVDGTPVSRMESQQGPVSPEPRASAKRPPAAPLPDWAVSAAQAERPDTLLAPSRLGGHLARGAAPAEQPPLGPREQSADGRFFRGRLVHALLQHLPEVKPEAREAAAWAFVAARGAGLPAGMQDEIVGETLAILSDPTFAPLFGPSSQAEVPIVARIGDGDEALALSGQIDRLVVHQDGLLVLDYKTNRPPPTTPAEVAPAYIAQLAAYRIALKELFPGRALRAALLWTDGPQLMEIPSTLLDVAEAVLLQRRGQP